MNPNLEHLQPYPFEKLAKLKAGVTPPAHLKHIPLSIGEPKHPPPEFVVNIYQDAIKSLASYPTTKGISTLRQSIANWLERRFKLPKESINADHHVLPANGTREALFAFIQAQVNSLDGQQKPKILMPNPFYQIYEGAALLAGAEPVFLDCRAESDYLPDFDTVSEETWSQCQVLFICNPGNPTGAVIDIATLQKLIKLANEFNFVIASDECYSEIYADETNPPPGLLEAAAAMGNIDYQNCVVFHSLSKRSNLPGLRSGFIAGDADIISGFFKYRTYQGCALPLNVQHASIAAWDDEQHVIDSRQLYRQKFQLFNDILGDKLHMNIPEASFYLWPQLPISDEVFARELFRQQHITCLPGRYLGRAHQGGNNPGENHIRMALVAPLSECREAAERMALFMDTL